MKKKILFTLLLPATLFSQLTLVKDVRSGTTGSALSNFIVYNNSIVFKANDGTNGSELWKSDGTDAGTAIVSDYNTGSTSFNPQYFTLFNGKLYFQGLTATTGSELFSYDGTSISLFVDLKTGTGSSVPQNFTILGTSLIFKAQDPASTTNRIYKTDGVSAPTIVDNTIAVGLGFGSLNSSVLFAGGTSTTNYQLYSYDGSTVTLLKTINPSATSSPTNFYTSGNRLYFSATEATNGREPCITDGTTAGTTLLKNINPTGDSSPGNFYAYNGKVYFSANDGTNGIELWVSDGTDAGTVLLKDINAGSANSSPSDFFEYDGKLYFSANDGVNGNELWVTDGTAANTKLFLDINPGAASSSPTDLTLYNGKLYLAADTGTVGKELYYINAEVLRTNDKSVKSVGIFPNPSNGKIFSSNKENFDYQIFSLDGRLLESGKTNDGQANLKVNNGIYLIKTTNKGQTNIQKIIIKK